MNVFIISRLLKIIQNERLKHTSAGKSNISISLIVCHVVENSWKACNR